MSATVRREKLKHRVTNHVGVVQIYSIDLNDVEVSPINSAHFTLLSKKLRTLLRAKQNLVEARTQIQLLESNLSGKWPKVSEMDKALFAHAVVLFGACFVKGGSERAIPLGDVPIESEFAELHKEIMLYRHKLVSHLDDDHDVRTDSLCWEMSPSETGLTPNGPHLNGSKVILVRGAKNCAWIVSASLTLFFTAEGA